MKNEISFYSYELKNLEKFDISCIIQTLSIGFILNDERYKIYVCIKYTNN